MKLFWKWRKFASLNQLSCSFHFQLVSISFSSLNFEPFCWDQLSCIQIGFLNLNFSSFLSVLLLLKHGFGDLKIKHSKEIFFTWDAFKFQGKLEWKFYKSTRSFFIILSGLLASDVFWFRSYSYFTCFSSRPSSLRELFSCYFHVMTSFIKSFLIFFRNFSATSRKFLDFFLFFF